jgi:hypothetical protein
VKIYEDELARRHSLVAEADRLLDSWEECEATTRGIERRTQRAAFTSDFEYLTAEIEQIDDGIRDFDRRMDRKYSLCYYPYFGRQWRRYVVWNRLPGWRAYRGRTDAQ